MWRRKRVRFTTTGDLNWYIVKLWLRAVLYTVLCIPLSVFIFRSQGLYFGNFLALFFFCTFWELCCYIRYLPLFLFIWGICAIQPNPLRLGCVSSSLGMIENYYKHLELHNKDVVDCMLYIIVIYGWPGTVFPDLLKSLHIRRLKDVPVWGPSVIKYSILYKPPCQAFYILYSV